MFMWLLTQEKIQCRQILQKKHIVPTAICEVCGEHDETPEHIINGCAIARLFWVKIGVLVPPDFPIRELHKIEFPNSLLQQEFGMFIALSCWQLWKARNAFVFRAETTSVQQLITSCKMEVERWRGRMSRKKKPIADKWCSVFHQALHA